MTNRWAACLPESSAELLATLRHFPGVKICQHDEHLWLRGDRTTPDLERTLRAVSGAERFAMLDDGQLVPAGRRVPSRRLPPGPWQPLSQWLLVALPGTVLAGQVLDRVPLRLVRDAVPAEPRVLLTTAAAWRSYAETAPEVRLRHCLFAVDDRQRVVVWGHPLPPVRGTLFVEQHGIAVAAGWAWSPSLDAEVLRAAAGLERGDLLLLHANGGSDRIANAAFVRARRSAIRLSTGAGTP
jgi:hypothetical protein